MDLCFATDAQLTDGICRSAWGIQPLWQRAMAWWARDMVMLLGLAYFLDFSMRWTHSALGVQVPRAELNCLRTVVAIVMLEMSLCAIGLLASNSFAWMFGLLIGVIGMNAVATFFAKRLLWDLLPSVQKLHATTAAGVIAEAQLASMGIVCLAVAVLGVFLPLSFLRLLDGALTWRLIPHLPHGSWIGSTVFPVLTSVPAEVLPNPAVEAVELSIGWAFSIVVLLSGGCHLERPRAGFVSPESLGTSMAKAD